MASLFNPFNQGLFQSVLNRVLIAPIKWYQWMFSPYVGASCRFSPSCSNYAIEAIGQHGAFKGTYLTVCRLGRCHPWCAGGHDPVP